MPRVSVVLPFNRLDDFVKLSIESILQNNFKDLELVLVADGVRSEELQTLQHFAEQPNVKLIALEKSGLVAALNFGIKMSDGEYLARMDSDDISSTQRLELQVAYLDSHPEVDVVGGQIQPICIHGQPIAPRSRYVRRLRREKLLKPLSCQVAHPTAMIRKSTLNRLNGYRNFGPDFFAEDLDLWNRVLRDGEIHNLSVVVLCYRIHHSQISSRKKIEQSMSTEFAIAADIFETMSASGSFTLSESTDWKSELKNFNSRSYQENLTLLGRLRYRAFISYNAAVKSGTDLAFLVRNKAVPRVNHPKRISNVLLDLAKRPLASMVVALQHTISLMSEAVYPSQFRCNRCLGLDK
jgi:glycosyltransferase involved in cell wall biosynthesis